MTEEQFAVLEGYGDEPKDFYFFVKSEKRENFISFLKDLHLQKCIKVKKGNGIYLFLLDIRKRNDFKQLQKLLNELQCSYLK